MPNWDAVLQEIGKTKPVPPESEFDIVRRRYMRKLFDHTGRNVISYYSGFLTKPKVEGVEINDEDKNGFMLCCHKIDRSKGLDLILHTPGGNGAATESIVYYLRQMFGDNIRAIVPQIAMSAGTIIACSCNELVMGKHSNIGPVDPQLSGIPAIGVIEEVKAAFKEIKTDIRAAHVWNPILSRLPPSFLQQCQWATDQSKKFIAAALENGNLSKVPEPDKTTRLTKAVERLTDLTQYKSHDRHFHVTDCLDMGLEVTPLETGVDKVFQDLVLTVHHCFAHTLANTGSFKIIENHLGRASVRQVVQQNVILQLPTAPPPKP